jgi:hypothetical protein
VVNVVLIEAIRSCLKFIYRFPHASFWLQLRWFFRRSTSSYGCKIRLVSLKNTLWVIPAIKFKQLLTFEQIELDEKQQTETGK